ncbi:hypothetical protein LCGC14_2184940 [marine sediment metagenome]|uniref:Uncharacterized protein n=1 Tax=marine sediment metagenome TaxID=412755 RepID=A0A0F9E899_9ZZZZ
MILADWCTWYIPIVSIFILWDVTGTKKYD